MNPKADTNQMSLVTVLETPHLLEVIKQQERILVNLEGLQKGFTNFESKVSSHDEDIVDLQKDMVSVKHSIEDIDKKLEKPKLHPAQLIGTALGAVVSAGGIVAAVVLFYMVIGGSA